MAAGAGSAGYILLGDGGVGIDVRLDGVDAVTVCADRGQAVAAGDSLPVNALHEGLRHRAVAFAAGDGHVEFVDGRLGVVGGKNVVGAVAIGADCGLG